MTRHERRQKWRKAWKPDMPEPGPGRAERRAALEGVRKQMAEVRLVLRAREKYAAKKAAKEARRAKKAAR